MSILLHCTVNLNPGGLLTVMANKFTFKMCSVSARDRGASSSEKLAKQLKAH